MTNKEYRFIMDWAIDEDDDGVERRDVMMSNLREIEENLNSDYEPVRYGTGIILT